MRCGLLGEKLGHSYSPQIHALLADYDYQLFEKQPEELEAFIKDGDWDGLNVTIPYKKTVLPWCAELSDRARRIGAVNTLVRRVDGTIYGENTDAYGFETMLNRAGIDVPGRKCLVLGSGGASVMAVAVLEDLGARSVTVISRHGADNYDNLDRHADAQVLVNTTPVGMYPKTGVAPVELALFPKCEAVVDVVYNPARTALLLRAEERGIPCAGGLTMLVAQAKRASELFTGRAIADGEIDRIARVLRKDMLNIVLIGMPGSGKSSVAKLLAERLGREAVECDRCVAEAAGKSIPEIFAGDGEEGFRRLETAVLSEQGKRSGVVLSTGGGCVTREENYPLLHQNGTIFWLQRAIHRLPKDGRPLSQKNDLHAMYARREPLYERFADHIIDNNGTLDAAVNAILEVLE